MFRLMPSVILIALVFSVCSKPPGEKGNTEKPREPVKADLRRETVEEGIEVTFYPTYGYRNGDDWIIPTRTWVHEKRAPQLISGAAEIAEMKVKCVGLEKETVKSRLTDFLDDDSKKQKVTIQFDSDPDKEQFHLGEGDPNGGESDLNGLIQTDLRLSEARARKLLESQGSSQGWLTYHAVSPGYTGKGRIRLIDPEGISVVSDIDDTIKVTEVPAEQAVVLRNTFCRDFIAAPEMADRYKKWGDASFHYVSGGPWQLYGPLSDFLIRGPGGFPEGTFHLSYFPKNLGAEDTREFVRQAVGNALEKSSGSLENTYNHKLDEINILMDRFPSRKFILFGDSGEVDPEVYRVIRDQRPKQVQEIWIRDVVNDDAVNHDRLAGMKLIKVDPIICASPKHYQKLSTMLAGLHRPAYARNELSLCQVDSGHRRAIIILILIGSVLLIGVSYVFVRRYRRGPKATKKKTEEEKREP